MFTLSTPALAFDQQPTNASRELVASKAVLTNEAGEAVCVVNIAGEQELVPHGAKAAPEGFKSRINLGLRACNRNEMATIWQQASNSYVKPKHGLLPVIAGAIAVCRTAAIASALFGVYWETAYGEYERGQFFPGFATGIFEGEAKLPVKSGVVRMGAGGVIGLGCGAVAQVATRTVIKGVVYVMENGLPKVEAPKKHRTR